MAEWHILSIYSNNSSFAKQILPKTDLLLKETAAARDSYFILANKTLPNEVEWGLYKILF